MDSTTGGSFDIFTYREKIAALDQAMFHVYDDTGEKQAIGLVTHFNFDEEGNLFFCASRLPVIAANWNTFDAELQCYKKGVQYNIQLSGTATIEDGSSRLICFKANDIKFNGEEEKAEGKYAYLFRQWGFLKSLLRQQRAASF